MWNSSYYKHIDMQDKNENQISLVAGTEEGMEKQPEVLSGAQQARLWVSVLLGWDGAVMSGEAVGQCYRGLNNKAKRCRAALSKKEGLEKEKKKVQPLNQGDAKNVCLPLGSGRKKLMHFVKK